jgi:hypothetical protein
MVAEARLWSRLVAVVAVIIAVSFRQVIRWQADLGPAGSAERKPEVRPYVRTRLNSPGRRLSCNPGVGAPPFSWGFILSPSATLRVAGLAPRVKVEHPTV